MPPKFDNSLGAAPRSRASRYAKRETPETSSASDMSSLLERIATAPVVQNDHGMVAVKSPGEYFVVDRGCHHHHKKCDKRESESGHGSPSESSSSLPKYRSRDRSREPTNDSCGFTALILPVTDLRAVHSSHKDQISFVMRRKNKVVTLQWETFTGQLGATAVSHLTVNQSICNLPPYPVEIPIRIIYRGESRTTYLRIDPSNSEHLQIFLRGDGTGTDVSLGDNFTVPGSAVSWITE